MSKRLMVVLVGVMALAVFAAGCGSSSDDEAVAEAPPLTKVAFIKKANTICRQLNEDTAKKYEGFFKADPSKAEQQAISKRVYLPNLEARLDALRDLPAPKGSSAEVEAMLDAFEAAIRKVDAKHLIAFKGTPLLFAKSNKLARGYGLTYCSTY